MTITTALNTIPGQIRLKIADRDTENIIFQDADLEYFYSSEGNSVLRASAAALEAIAIDQILVLKVVTRLGLSTNGASVGAALQKLAESYREQADLAEAQAGTTFDVIETVGDTFTYYERLLKERQRGA